MKSSSRQTIEIEVYKKRVAVMQRWIIEDEYNPIFLARSTFAIDVHYSISKSLGGWNGWILSIMDKGQYVNYYVDIDDIKITIIED